MSERDEALAERDELRSLLVRVINEGTDGTSNESVSMDFLRHVPSECASVKRERDECEEKIEQLRRGVEYFRDKLIDTERERDEAREQASYWKSQYELEKGLYVIELK